MMMATIPTQIRIDSTLKQQAADLFSSLGMDMSGAVSNQTKSVQQSLDDLGISSDISGQYSEEMNKAMDQYNKEMDKAMDEYNQQVQDM